MEVSYRKPVFPWMPRLWRDKIGSELIDYFPEDPRIPLEGLLMLLLGLDSLSVLIPT